MGGPCFARASPSYWARCFGSICMQSSIGPTVHSSERASGRMWVGRVRITPVRPQLPPALAEGIRYGSTYRVRAPAPALPASALTEVLGAAAASAASVEAAARSKLCRITVALEEAPDARLVEPAVSAAPVRGPSHVGIATCPLQPRMLRASRDRDRVPPLHPTSSQPWWPCLTLPRRLDEYECRQRRLSAPRLPAPRLSAPCLSATRLLAHSCPRIAGTWQ